MWEMGQYCLEMAWKGEMEMPTLERISGDEQRRDLPKGFSNAWG